jgi:hypothetical protein
VAKRFQTMSEGRDAGSKKSLVCVTLWWWEQVAARCTANVLIDHGPRRALASVHF